MFVCVCVCMRVCDCVCVFMGVGVVCLCVSGRSISVYVWGMRCISPCLDTGMCVSSMEHINFRNMLITRHEIKVLTDSLVRSSLSSSGSSGSSYDRRTASLSHFEEGTNPIYKDSALT